MDRVALIPIVAFAADLGIASPFEGVKIRLRMGMAVAPGVRQIDGKKAPDLFPPFCPKSNEPLTGEFVQ
jgi:hypothetical protein